MNDLNAWFKYRQRWMQEATGLLLTEGRMAGW